MEQNRTVWSSCLSHLWSQLKLQIPNWFPGPAAPQKAHHHYWQGEEREGTASKIPDNYLPLVNRVCKKELRGRRGRENNIKETLCRTPPPCPFLSCKCALTLQLAGMGIAEVWRRKINKLYMTHTHTYSISLLVLGQNIPFHTISLCLCVQIMIICAGKVMEMNRQSTGPWLSCNFLVSWQTTQFPR